jgi:hypothetical protein
MKVKQVSECAWLDWCNLIGIQITTTYKIHFVPELELKDSTNTASSASYLELCPEKLTVRVVWERNYTVYTAENQIQGLV